MNAKFLFYLLVWKRARERECTEMRRDDKATLATNAHAHNAFVPPRDHATGMCARVCLRACVFVCVCVRVRVCASCSIQRGTRARARAREKVGRGVGEGRERSEGRRTRLRQEIRVAHRAHAMNQIELLVP